MTEIVIENFEINSAMLIVDYFLNGKYFAENFPLNDFENFCVVNNILDWGETVMRNNEHVADLEGTWDFHDWCNEKLSEKEIRQYLIHKLANG